jgi:gliding motility-associated-like protein
MKKNLLVALLLVIAGNTFSQITINNTLYTTNQLVNGVLVPGGSGTVVSNINFRGVYGVSSKYQIGYFSTTGPTQTAMGFSNGIYLSTGNTSTVPLALGTNPGSVAQMSTLYTSGTSGELRSSNPAAGQDADLGVLISPYNYYNGAVLEFDFVPVSTVASFRYIFASEEYNDESGSAFAINYNCSGYNDKFAFLISGPGISGGQGYLNNALNVATLANGSEVGINSVNDGIVGSSGSPQNAGLCTIENPGWINNTPTPEFMGFINGTNYNGNTDILTATKSGLTPGLTYHIKIIIADANDAGYDSGVYLEAGSFTTLSCIDPAAPTIGAITQPTCSTPTASVALSGLPTSGTWTVTANPGGATLSGTGSTGSFTGLSANTSYAFIVTNAAGCMSMASANALVSAIPAGPTAPIIGAITQPSCLSPTGTVALSGLPNTGTWTITASPGGLTQTGSGTSVSFTGLSSNTTYTFTVTNSAGCTSVPSSNAVVSLYTPTAPIIGVITQPTCLVANGSVALSGLPSSGTWTVTASPGGSTITGTGTTGLFTLLTAGTTYTFVVTNSSGCLSGASVAAIINPQPLTPSVPVIGLISQPTCVVTSGSVALSGLPSTGTWTLTTIPGGTITGTGTTTTISSLAAAASYTFTITNTSGCTSLSSTSASINAIPTAPSAPIVGVITQPSCLNPTGSVALSGLPATAWTITSSPGGLTQSGSGTTATFTGLPSNATYTFTVTNTTSLCASVASSNAIISLYTPTPPIVGVITQPTCTNNTGSVALSGLPSGSWTITPSPSGTPLISSGLTTSFSGLAAGSTYTFTVTNNSGCISVASTSAVINSQPSTPIAPATGAITQPTCLDNTGSIELTGLPSGNWTINTIPGGAVGGSGSTYTFTGLPASSSYSYTITNEEGCTSITAITASVNSVPSLPNAPIIGTITQPTCTDPVGSVELSSLPIGTWVITATPGGTVTAGGSITAIIDLSANATYTFTVTDANGCTSSMSASVNIAALPAAPNAPTASVTVQPSCIIGTATIEVSAPIGANYTYSIDGIIFQAGTNFAGLSPNSSYDVYAQDATTGCISFSTSLVVNPLPPGPAAPVVNINAQPTCLVQSGTIEIVSPIGANFQIYIDGVPMPIGTYIFSGLAPSQTYSVTIVDLTTGCGSAPFDVNLNGIPTAEIVNAGPDYLIQSGETVTLTASGNGTIVWNTGDAISTNVAPTITTTYTATMTDANGCIDTDEAIVTIDIDCGELFIPTAFSPNGDAVNSSFRIKINPACVKELNLKVFDRWGEVVFQTTSPDGSWDGKFKGKELDSGVFVYVLEIMLDTDTELQKFKGNLSLIK